MKPQRKLIRPGSFLVVVSLAVAFLVGCSSYAKSTSVRTDKQANDVDQYRADEFVGVPIVGDYDDNPDLDFILNVADKDRTFKIKVHEDAGKNNLELLDKVRDKINAAVDKDQLRVVGFYSSEYKGPEKEYGFMALKTLVFFDEKTGYEEAYFTDDSDSRFYKDGDVTVVYAPGQHYRAVYYPRFCSPWWDADGDGIPDQYDPWPYNYDVWYDYNMNGFPDWYDPAYCGVYPYWSHWDVGFWLSYNWYSPGYFRFYRARPSIYYGDYLTYSRLYDHRMEGRPDRGYRLSPRYNPNGSATLDVKAQNRDRGTYGGGTMRGDIAGAAGGGIDRYAAASGDRRRYSPVSDVSGGAYDPGSGAHRGDASRPASDVFTRNNTTDVSTGDTPNTRYRGYTVPQAKTKAGDTGGAVEPRQTTSDRNRSTIGSGEAAGGGNRSTYVPSSRSRVVGGESSGNIGGSTQVAPAYSGGSRVRATTATTPSSGRVTAPTSSAAPSRASTESRYRGSYVTSRSSGGYTAPSSARGDSGSRPNSGNGGSYTPSGSRSSQPAARPAPSSPSRSRSTPAAAPSSGSRSAPAASQPSSSGSRSRSSSGSSSSSSRDSGGGRGRR